MHIEKQKKKKKKKKQDKNTHNRTLTDLIHTLAYYYY